MLPSPSSLYFSLAPIYAGLMIGYTYGKNGSLSGKILGLQIGGVILLGIILWGLGFVKQPVVMAITWLIPIVLLLGLIGALVYYFFIKK